MTIERIDTARCIGCGTCVDTCPMDVLRLDEKTRKAVIQYPEDCQLCGLCAMDCPREAIYVSPEKRTPVLTSWG
jgi:NAD-dependent dihydropyrimidine dehydrogenase PreA subunit